MKNCKRCGQQFEVVKEDLDFYEKVSPVFKGKKYLIPEPTFCPGCREMRRLSWRNERNLYKRKCDLTGKNIVSMYSPDKPYKVYDREVWWEDKWDPLEFGQDFDFGRSFFDQFNRLILDVPRLSLFVRLSENCDYNNEMSSGKNCYMCFTTFISEDMYYCYWAGLNSKDSVDCSHYLYSELCYGCLDCTNCYGSYFLQNCKQVHDSYFLYDCVECKNCFLSTGLRHKEYYFLNKKLSKDEYKEALNKVLPLTYSNIEKLKVKFEEMKLKHPRKHLLMNNCENCVGDYVNNSKNCTYSYDILEGEDLKYCYGAGLGKDFMDATQCGYASELLYDIQSGDTLNHSCFTNACWNCNDLYYCDFCFFCKNCFGCSGLQHKEYCILNKQYTKDEYEELAPKIIGKMIEGGEWGEFFPTKISPFGYNETVASQYFELSQEDVIGKGWKWNNYEAEAPKVSAIVLAKDLPEKISDVKDDILDKAIECEVSGKPFRIVKRELDLCRKMGIPLPHRHPDLRHMDRVSMRNPRKLWDRKCMKCGVDIKTSYVPERKEIVYCEKCYLEALN